MAGFMHGMSSHERQDILSRAVTTLLPDPGVHGKVEHQDEPAVDAFLLETRKSLGLKPDDFSAAARNALLQFLGDEISRQVLGDKDLDQIRARIGRQGDLPPAQYRLEFQQDFSSCEEQRGIQRQQVAQAIHEPDAYQHLPPVCEQDDESLRLSIFVRSQQSSDHEQARRTLIVHGQRDGDMLTVHKAWRVYQGDVELAEFDSPLSMLRAFAETYGVEFSIRAGEPKAKFFTGELLSQFDRDSVPLGDHKLEACFVVRESPLDIVELGIGYVIDLARYAAHLAHHGEVIPN